MPSKPSLALLNSIGNYLYPPTGTVAYVALLDNILSVSTSIANITTDEITTATDQKWRTGSRIRFTTTGTLPAPLALLTDYFVIAPATATMFPGPVFRLATTLANAIAEIPINLTTIGTGVHTATEQLLTENDPLSVLVAHEFDPHPGYQNRFTIADLGNPLTATLESYKVATFSYVNNSTASKTIKHIALISGGSPYIFDGAGNVFLETPAAVVVCAVATPKAYSIRLSVKGI